ncbi:hypothetical protein [Microlunatus endophyticus]|uniref:hypothetical protein n=1 Tax=Microlunatus endophyticus TaxID=1716077 RepID=UPI00166E97BD|nr:hypothetical protein [Microlunatus endophyticus]
MADQTTAASTAFARARLIQKTAEADAAAVTERLLLAERAAATSRFETFWPTPTPSRTPSITRRTLQAWYVRVVENQLARGLMAPANAPIDGAEAEKMMALVRRRTGADSAIVVDVVIELARDARLVADQIAEARPSYLEAALRGRISQIFQRQPQRPVGIRQALAEQWYARAFHATADPPLYRKPTPPVTAAETHAVAVSLASGQAHVLHRNGRPIGPATPKAWQAHAAKQWATTRRAAKRSWLTERGFDTDFATTSFHHLPLMLQSELLALHPPAEKVLSQRVAPGTPTESAAEAFSATPIEPATNSDLYFASILFSPRGVTLPRNVIGDLPDDTAVQASLDALHAANHDRVEIRGHRIRRVLWTDEQRVRAVEMRRAGKPYTEIGAELGMSDEQVSRALREDSDIAPELVTKQDRTRWTEEQIRVAAYLRSQGHTYNQIAAVFGYKSAGTIRAALTTNGPELGIDPVTGHTYGPGETMPDPRRWAPRNNPWDGSIRKEDQTYLAERLKQAAQEAKANTRDRAKTRGVDIEAVLDRAVARRREMAKKQPTLSDEDGRSGRGDGPTTRRPHR